MAIWFDGFPLEQARSSGRDTLIDHLDIELLEAGDDFLKARMPVDPRTRQPAGVLHGGASVTLAKGNLGLLGRNLPGLLREHLRGRPATGPGTLERGAGSVQSVFARASVRCARKRS